MILGSNFTRSTAVEKASGQTSPKKDKSIARPKSWFCLGASHIRREVSSHLSLSRSSLTRTLSPFFSALGENGELGTAPAADILSALFFSSFFFFNLTYSRWTSSLPSCLWSHRIFPSLPGSRLTIFYRDASSSLLQLVNQWLNFSLYLS